MKYFRIMEEFGSVHLCVQTKEDELTSLTSINELVKDYKNLLDTSHISKMKVDEITEKLLENNGKTYSLEKLIDSSIN